MAQFLSDEWLEAAKAIYEEYRGKSSTPPPLLRMNMIIKDCPEGVGQDGTVNAHMDSTSGEMELDIGHLDEPQLTATLAYDLAKKLLVANDSQAGMQAFMSGQITIQGDVTKIMALQSGATDPVQAEIAEKIQAITD